MLLHWQPQVGMATSTMLRLREMMAKYGKVAVGVHLSVSAICLTGCYVAIRSSVDVEGLLERVGLYKGDKDVDVANIQARLESVEGAVENVTGVHHLGGAFPIRGQTSPSDGSTDEHRVNGSSSEESHGSSRSASVGGSSIQRVGEENGSRAASLGSSAVKGGSAFALAFLCNKILFPVRVPVTLALTPRVWRLLKDRGFRV